MSRVQKIGLAVTILAAIAVVLIYLPPRGYRLDDKTKVQLDRVGELVLDWKKRQGRFPNDSEGLSVLIQSGVATEDGITDGWGDRLRYQCSDPQCSSALIYSLGPNKMDEHGGGDDLSLKLSR